MPVKVRHETFQFYVRRDGGRSTMPRLGGLLKIDIYDLQDFFSSDFFSFIWGDTQICVCVGFVVDSRELRNEENGGIHAKVTSNGQICPFYTNNATDTIL